jgi:hypothetical protein
MYCSRLIDVLAEDYPRVAATLGADAFGSLAHEYVAAHPSTHPSLRWFGRAFPDFLAANAGDHPPFLADLARLEWARLEVFDAADAEILAVDTLRALAPEQWPSLRLRLVPACVLLPVAWPVHRIWADETPAEWQPEDACLRVWRQDDQVFQTPVDASERAALRLAQDGGDFAAMCDALAAVVPADEVATTAGAVLLRWIADGLLCAAT